MTQDKIRKDIQDFVAMHNRFPSREDIPTLPSLRTLQRHGIHISQFIEKSLVSSDRVEKMQDSSQKILDSVSELAFLLHNKGYEVKTNQAVKLYTPQRVNIVCIDKKTSKKYAIELVYPSSRLSVPTSVRRKMFKFDYITLQEYETVFIVNTNESMNIGYYRPRTPINPKIKIINLSDLPL
jgi:hypothetical protein